MGGSRQEGGKKTTKDKNVIISWLIRNCGEVAKGVGGGSLETVQKKKGKELFTLKDLNLSHTIGGIFLSSQIHHIYRCCFCTSPGKVRKQHFIINNF